jgi:Domain of unknown function (DUF4272)
MRTACPDPVAVREVTLHRLAELGLPLPPERFPLVWEPGDEVELRPRAELEARCAVLNVVLARSFGLPAADAFRWLDGAGLTDRLTPPERDFVADGTGDALSFALHTEALAALAWLLSLVRRLDPAAPGLVNAAPLFPDVAGGEEYRAWQGRTLAAPRDPREAAAALDLYYCLDWAYLDTERRQDRLPGLIDSNAIGQRRWALEWAVLLHGPFQDEAPSWEEVDLST